MKKINDISIYFLTLVMLISTQSFAINMHFCGEKLVDLAFSEPAKACAMHNKHKHPKPDNCSVDKENCCQNVQLKFDGQDDLSKVQTTELSQQQIQFIGAFVLALNHFTIEAHRDQSQNFNHPPPPLVKNIYQLDETYLI